MPVVTPHPLLARGVALYAVLAVAVPTAVAATTYRGRWAFFGVPASVIDVQIAYFWAAVAAVVVLAGAVWRWPRAAWALAGLVGGHVVVLSALQSWAIGYFSGPSPGGAGFTPASFEQFPRLLTQRLAELTDVVLLMLALRLRFTAALTPGAAPEGGTVLPYAPATDRRAGGVVRAVLLGVLLAAIARFAEWCVGSGVLREPERLFDPAAARQVAAGLPYLLPAAMAAWHLATRPARPRLLFLAAVFLLAALSTHFTFIARQLNYMDLPTLCRWSLMTFPPASAVPAVLLCFHRALAPTHR